MGTPFQVPFPSFRWLSFLSSPILRPLAAKCCILDGALRHLLPQCRPGNAKRSAATQQTQHLCKVRTHQVLPCFLQHLAHRMSKANTQLQAVKLQGCLGAASRGHLPAIWRAWGAKTSATTEQAQHFCYVQNNRFYSSFLYI